MNTTALSNHLLISHCYLYVSIVCGAWVLNIRVQSSLVSLYTQPYIGALESLGPPHANDGNSNWSVHNHHTRSPHLIKLLTPWSLLHSMSTCASMSAYASQCITIAKYLTTHQPHVFIPRCQLNYLSFPHSFACSRHPAIVLSFGKRLCRSIQPSHLFTAICLSYGTRSGGEVTRQGRQLSNSSEPLSASEPCLPDPITRDDTLGRVRAIVCYNSAWTNCHVYCRSILTKIVTKLRTEDVDCTRERSLIKSENCRRWSILC